MATAEKRTAAELRLDDMDQEGLEEELLVAVREHAVTRAEFQRAHAADGLARERLVAVLRRLEVTGFTAL